MIIAFLFIFVFASELIYSIAMQQDVGFNPYPFGVRAFSKILHPILLAMSVWYLGWLFGAILFACHMLGIIHATVGWILLIPSLFIRNDRYAAFKLMQFELNMLLPMTIIVFVFWIVSLFVTPYKTLYSFISLDLNVLIVPGIILAVCFILRFFVFHKISE